MSYEEELKERAKRLPKERRKIYVSNTLNRLKEKKEKVIVKKKRRL